MISPNSAELLAQVEKSPAAVAVHDKAAWMSIFAKYHIVEDPVGSKPHIGGLYNCQFGQRGNDALSCFFDTFIAPNKISFDVKRDIVCANHVVRDLTINIQMSDQVKTQVPMHLLYELGLENNEWKIIRLAAHWELMPMIGQLLKQGANCVPVLTALTIRMFNLQGISGMLGFSKAALNIGNAGKKAVTQFQDAFNSRNLADLMEVFCSDAPVISFPYNEAKIYPSQLFEKVSGNCQFSKIMAAGDSVTATLTYKVGDITQEGVVFFEFNRRIKKISGLRFYF